MRTRSFSDRTAWLQRILLLSLTYWRWRSGKPSVQPLFCLLSSVPAPAWRPRVQSTNCWADRGRGRVPPVRARQDSREETVAWAAQLLQGACSTTGLTTPGGEVRGEGVSGVSVLYLDHSNLLRGAGSRRGQGSLTSALTSSVSQ